MRKKTKQNKIKRKQKKKKKKEIIVDKFSYFLPPLFLFKNTNAFPEHNSEKDNNKLTCTITPMPVNKSLKLKC